MAGDPTIAKISIVGVGMRSHAGVASKMFQTLSDVGINIQMISTSEIKVSCVIDEKFIESAYECFMRHSSLISQGVLIEQGRDIRYDPA